MRLQRDTGEGNWGGKGKEKRQGRRAISEIPLLSYHDTGSRAKGVLRTATATPSHQHLIPPGNSEQKEMSALLPRRNHQSLQSRFGFLFLKTTSSVSYNASTTGVPITDSLVRILSVYKEHPNSTKNDHILFSVIFTRSTLDHVVPLRKSATQLLCMGTGTPYLLTRGEHTADSVQSTAALLLSHLHHVPSRTTR